MPISMDMLSGLSPEFQTAFQKAIQMEKKPIDNLQNKKEASQSKLNLLNDVITKVDSVKKLLPEINSANKLLELAVDSSDPKVFTATAEKGIASLGTHSVEVLQLASAAAALSNGFSDRNETKIGSGYFSFTNASGEVQEVFVDDENSTLDGIARIINSAGMGLKATVTTDQSTPETPFRLMLTSNKIGEDNGVEYPEFYFLDGEEDFFIDREKPATNAVIRYEGLALELPSNEVKDLIPGVTLNLTGVSDHPISLNISQDTQKTGSKIKEMVNSLNQVFTFIQQQNTVNEKSDTTKTLGGDYGIRTTEYRLRGALQDAFSSMGSKQIRALGDIGIQFNRNGTLNFDEKKLESALNNNFDQVANLIAGDGMTYGVVVKLGRALNSISGGQGALLTQQQKTLTDKVSNIDKDIEKKEKVLEKRAEMLRDKLAKAQQALSNMQSQSNNIAAQLMPR